MMIFKAYIILCITDGFLIKRKIHRSYKDERVGGQKALNGSIK